MHVIHAVSVFVCCCKNEVRLCVLATFFIARAWADAEGRKVAHAISPGDMIGVMYFIFLIAKYLELLSYSLWVMYCTEVPVQLFDLYREVSVAGSTIFGQVGSQCLFMLTRHPP
jgi:hypothetical protein